MTIDEILGLAHVIPVVVLDEAIDPVRLAETLVAAGLPVIEVTLRTSKALAAIRAMANVQGAVVGAGTVINPGLLGEAIDAGSRFIVAPGLTGPLAGAALTAGVPFLPGVATASDIMRGLDLGLTRFKFFPAEAAGGLPVLRALAAPFAGIRFCPTGGIREDTAARWLAEPSVATVGGSWIVPAGKADYEAISVRAKYAAGLRTDAA